MITRRSLLLASPAIILPRRLLAQSIGNNGISAAAGGSSSSSSVNLSPYIGLVGTRGTVNQQVSAGNFYANSRSFHYARTAFTTVQIALGAWYCNGVENPMGGPVTYQAALEYPLGTITPFTFSGASSGTAANNTTIFTDPLAVTVPVGAQFWIRVFQDAHLATSVACGWTGYTTGGDGIEVSPTSVASKTTSGTIAFTTGLGPIFPIGIVGVTNIPSVLCLGDSRVMGLADTADISGDIGEHARSIGPSFGYTNAGCSGENGFNFGNFFGTNPTDFVNRTAFGIAYCTHVLQNYGVNDIKNGQTTNMQAILQACWARFPTLKVIHTTIVPSTTSSDSFVTLANQSPATNFSFASNGTRQTTNQYIRTVPAPLAGYFEVSGAVEPVLDDGLWPVNGTPFWSTPDGLHESMIECLAIQAAKVIPPSAIHR